MPKTTTPTAPPDEDAPKGETPDAATAEPTEKTDDKSDAKSAKPALTEHKFFTWIRGLDLKRDPGWIGGVCAGVATKLGIDPLIVRGIVVVLAVLGAPVILLYAAAWLLLPDRAGQIHLQELVRGHVTPAFPAIVGLVLLSLLPLAQGFWYLGGLYWGVPDVWGGVGRAIWMAVLLIVVVVVVVWLARRASGDVTTSPATTDDRPETIPASPAAARAEAVFVETVPGAPPAPPTPPAGASDAELAAWKQNQAEWQQERAAWVAEQQRSEQERRQAEKQTLAEQWAKAAAERQRVRRITRPRASGAAVASILGLSLLVGAVGAFVATTRPEMADVAWEIGIAIFTIVVGVGAVVVGLARRRSGFLAFLGILGVLATIVSIGIPVERQLIPEGINYGLPLEDGSYARLSGTTTVYVQDAPGDAPTIDLWQATGDLIINLDEGSAVRLEAVTSSGTVVVQHFADGSFVGDERPGTSSSGGELTVATTIGDGDPDAVIRVWLGSGSVWVQVNDEGTN